MSASFNFADLSVAEKYKLLCASVIPRPVAWITSVSADGVVNAAPYSFFNVFSEEPAIAIVGLNRKADGSYKDTLVNAEATKSFTINLADTALAKVMVDTAAAFPAETSEPAATGLKLADGIHVPAPRLADAPVALECTLYEIKKVTDERHLLMGEVQGLVARDGLFDSETLRLLVPHWDPVARLYAANYASLSEPYEFAIPDWKTVTPAETGG